MDPVPSCEGVKLALAITAALLMLTPAFAVAKVGVDAESPLFGAEGTPQFVQIHLPSNLPGVDGAGEPTIGIPWTTDDLFFQAYQNTYRCDISGVNGTASGEAEPPISCTDVTPAFNTQVNLDPMLIADSTTGRIFAGGLAGACSVMGISDDNGDTWLPAGNMCSGHQFDHQTIGTGPWSISAPDTPGRKAISERAVYYCSQGDLLPFVTGAGAACATSLDGGFTWQPWTQVLGGCGSFHGHVKVSEFDGFAVLPFARCDQEVGYAFSEDNGLTWTSATIPDSVIGKAIGFDPAVAFSASGWMWYALANDLGIYVGLSKDHGATWEPLGNGTRLEANGWLNISALYTDPLSNRPLRFTTFTNVLAGDDDRAAITFLGTTDEGDKPFTECEEDAEGLVWHYYLAQTFDAGATWNVQRLSDDPVQVGGIWDGGGGVACRNLLDFNDADIDSRGRIVIGYADGCMGACAAQGINHTRSGAEKPTPDDSRGSYGTILVQTTGRGLFASQDTVAPPRDDGNVTVTNGDDQATPGPGLAFTAAIVAAAAVLVARRRR